MRFDKIREIKEAVTSRFSGLSPGPRPGGGFSRDMHVVVEVRLDEVAALVLADTR